MKRIAGLLALASLSVAGQAASQSQVYTFTGGQYEEVGNSPECTVGECVTYTTSQRAVMTLTFAAPLPANLTLADRSAAVTAYSLSDGVRTTFGPGANAAMVTVDIATDATGAVSDFLLILQRTPGPPYLTNTPTDPNSRLDYLLLAPDVSSVFGNGFCLTREAPIAAVTGPGFCSYVVGDDMFSGTLSHLPTVVTSAPVAAAIPTLSEWAMILLGLMLAGGSALCVQRRQMPV